MARKYLTPIDLTGLELQNFKIQNLSTNPSAYGKGHTYYNTTANELRTYNGTSWETVGGNVISGATGSRPAAGHAGRLYFDTTLSILFFDNGTAWVQDGVSQSDLTSAISGAALGSTDDLSEGSTHLYFTTQRARESVDGTDGISYSSSSGNFSINYTSLESQLVTDGFAKTSDIPSFTSIASDLTATSTYISASGDIIDVNISALESKLTTDGFASQSDISTALSSYLTSSDAASTYLTISNASSTYLTQTDAGNTYLTQSDASSTYQTQSGLDSAVGGLGYIKIGDVPSAYITSVGSNLSVTAGELDLGANVVITDATQTLTNKTIGDKLNFTGYTNPSDGYIWSNTGTGALEIFSEYDIRLSPSGIIDAVGTEAHATKIEFHLSDDTNRGVVLAHPSDGSLTVAAINQLNLESHNGDITFYPDNQVVSEGNFSTTSGNNITSGNNLYVKSAIYAGGTDQGADGSLNIQDSSGNNTFVVNASTGAATVDVHGTQNFYASQPDGGTEYGILSYDADKNFVINANNNHLILQADSSQYYLGSVADGNKIVKKSDLTELSSGLDWKNAANLLWDDAGATLTGATGSLVIDGHPALGTAQAGYRILITNGTNAGIWDYADDGDNWTLTRPTDADVYTKLIGAAIFIMEGTKYAATSWVQNNHYLTDFTGQTWNQFSGQGTYTAGNGINIDGREISVKLDSDSLSESVDGLKVNYHTDGGLDNDGGLYVKTGLGLEIDGSGNVAIDTAVVARKYSTTIGNTSNTTYTVTHDLGTRDVEVSVYDASTYEEVIVDVARTSTNIVTIGFAVAPGVDAYRVVVLG